MSAFILECLGVFLKIELSNPRDDDDDDDDFEDTQIPKNPEGLRKQTNHCRKTNP